LTAISVEQSLDPTRGVTVMIILKTKKSGTTHHRPFEARETWNGRIVVLSVCDVLDLDSAPNLAEAIDYVLASAPAGLIVDLTDVDFLASAGMSVLVDAQEQSSAISARYGVVADGAGTSRPLRLLGIDAIVPIYPTLDDALRDLR
jgi:anti-sigma B factor antagonist